MDSNRYFAEIIRRACIRIIAGELKGGCLPMIFRSKGDPICRVTGDGEVHYKDGIWIHLKKWRHDVLSQLLVIPQ